MEHHRKRLPRWQPANIREYIQLGKRALRTTGKLWRALFKRFLSRFIHCRYHISGQDTRRLVEKRLSCILYPHSQRCRLGTRQPAAHRRRTGPGTVGNKQLQPPPRHESRHLLPRFRDDLTQRKPVAHTCGAHQQYGTSQPVSGEIQCRLRQLHRQALPPPLAERHHNQQGWRTERENTEYLALRRW